MNESRFALKVGVFVAIGLALVGGLLLSFSKGLSLFTPTYSLILRAGSVGGLKKNANVLLSGVPVGRVTGFDVAPTGQGVQIHLNIESRYQSRIQSNARFAIEQQGLLGDQYIEITPQTNAAPVLQPGQTVQAEQPLSIQGTARSVQDLIQLASQTLTSINTILERANRIILTENSMNQLAQTLENLNKVSGDAERMVGEVEHLLSTNTPAINLAVSNLLQFSSELNRLSSQMNELVGTNSVELTKGVKNLQTASQTVEKLVREVEAGQGMAGLVLKDQVFRQQISNTASNLALFSKSLTEHGLFHNFFFKPKPPKPAESPKKAK